MQQRRPEAPDHPGGVPGLPDWVTREAYSHEVYSCGFWPGGPSSPSAAFYAYAYPVPDGLSEASIAPPQAFWSGEMGEFFLPYEAVRTADDPADVLMSFLQDTYQAVADLGNWNRGELEVAEWISSCEDLIKPAEVHGDPWATVRSVSQPRAWPKLWRLQARASLRQPPD